MSPTSLTKTGLVGIGAGIVGFAVGLAFPTVVRALSSKLNKKSATTAVHVVRAGLSKKSIRLSRSKLDDLLSQILVAVGCSPQDAKLVANVLSYADSRGIPSHGANRLDAYVNEIRAGLVNAGAQPFVESCSGSCAVVNGNNGLGPVTSKFAMELAISLANEKGGLSIVTCHSSNHFGAAGYWAKLALDEGRIGMSFTNTSPIAVPTGGKTRALGTNPFCFFAPASTNGNRRESFQLDMATTTVPIGKIEVMDRIGKPTPLGWGVDRNGMDTTDAAEICKFGGLYPLGGPEETAGYKGYGLGMFVEVLCSVLSGASVGPNVPSWSITRGGPLNYGHCFIVIDPNRFTPGFEGRLGQYLAEMRGVQGNVKVAGDPEAEFERDAEMNGIVLHEAVAVTIKSLAHRYGVRNVPEELSTLDETKSKASLYEA